MDGIVDAYFGDDIRILVSDPSLVDSESIKATLNKLEIVPSMVANVGSI
jgi:hypothetical protein